MKRATYESYKAIERVLDNNLKGTNSDNVASGGMSYATTREMLDLLGEDSSQRSFVLCCKMGLTDIVGTMLEQGVDPTTDNFNAFRFASEQGHDEVLELLLQSIDVQEFDKQLQECSALAIKYKRKQCVEVLHSYV